MIASKWTPRKRDYENELKDLKKPLTVTSSHPLTGHAVKENSEHDDENEIQQVSFWIQSFLDNKKFECCLIVFRRSAFGKQRKSRTRSVVSSFCFEK